MKKEQLTQILKALKKEDYFKNVDLHIHTNYSDGILNPFEIIDYAQKNDLKYISITDHNTIDAYLCTNILRKAFLISGVEFDCLYKGVLVHILGYGIDIDNLELKSLYANNKSGCTHNIQRLMNLRNPKEVIEKIKSAGGIPVLAHPCCYWAKNLDLFVKDFVDMGIEGIETYYNYSGMRKIVKFHNENIIESIADKYNLIKTGGTDKHK